MHKIKDLVVDTNVFVHSHNQGTQYHYSSKNVLDAIVAQNKYIALDDVFDTDESKNTSRIGSEYFHHIRHGSYGYGILLHIISNGQTISVDKKQYSRHKKEFKKIISNTSDIVFLQVALGVASKKFISNDFQDFTSPKRKTLKNKFNITIVSSDQVEI